MRKLPDENFVTRASYPLTVAEEKARVAELRHQFIARYQVYPCKNRPSNYMNLFLTGGKSRDEINGKMGWRLKCANIYSRLFDHPEIWSRDGSPAILVGHPYPDCLSYEDLYILDEFKEIGLTVQSDGQSYYGFGTIQFLVFAGPVVLRRRSRRAGAMRL
jgi:hypothetical protein